MSQQTPHSPAPKKVWQLLQKTERDSLAWDLDGLALGTQKHIGFLNAHAVVMAETDPAFCDALLGCDHLLRDGVGVEIAFRRLALRATENLNGTDLIPKILDRFKTRRIAVWGSSQEALEQLRARLEAEGFTDLAPMHHGFHGDDFYLEEFSRSRPEVLVLCMGMPRQEILSTKLAAEPHNTVLICAGGWANFHSGHVTRAPKLMQRLKLEWLHRLTLEPFRMAPRYIVGGFTFFRAIARANKARALAEKP